MTQFNPVDIAHPAQQPRIDPTRSMCVLIGVDDYTSPELEKLKSVRHNRSRLREVLVDSGIGGFSEDRVVVEANPLSARAITRAIDAAGERAEDALIVYYSGHGLLGSDGGLYLTLANSELDRTETWADARHVHEAIKRSRARRFVLILDCCYSGGWRTGGGMGAGDGVDLAVRTLEGIQGSYVMASAPHNRISHAPDPDQCSVFTDALVKVMREGVPDGGEFLSLGDVFHQVQNRVQNLKLPGVPSPQSKDENGLAALGFVRNAALRRPASPVPPPPPQRWGRSGALALGLTLGLMVGLAAWPMKERMQGHESASAVGDCSSRAALLDHSDALKAQEEVDNEKFADISGLSYVPGKFRTAYAVTDNRPTRVFPLRTGDARNLKPVAQRAVTLRPKGEELGLRPDGEALALEEGGTSVLVAFETGPSIRRFSLVDGSQKGEEFVLPSSFKAGPDGEAQAGRTIESLALSENGNYLYVGLEAPLSRDGDERGKGLLRIQRYAKDAATSHAGAGGVYKLDRQFAYRTDAGLNLVELVAVGDDRLLALERNYTVGLGNAVRVKDISLRKAKDVAKVPTLYKQPADLFVKSSLVFDMLNCPAGDSGEVAVIGRQVNPLLGNVEGMTLGPEIEAGPYKGRRSLLMIADDNASAKQFTRLYSFAVKL